MSETLTANLENVVANLSGKPHYETLNGRQYLVVPMTILKEGVLAGSQGPLFYHRSDIQQSTPDWDRIPLTVYHPISQDGRHLSANDEGVLEKQGIGFFAKPVYHDNLGKTTGLGYIDVVKCGKVNRPLLNTLKAGQKVELSTGLFTNNIPAANGSHYFGKPYRHHAKDYRPDHIAILPDQVGACSIRDGCGVYNRRTLPQVSPTTNEVAVKDLKVVDFVQFRKGQRDGTRCTNCMYTDGVKKKDRDGTCTFHGVINGKKVDLRGTKVFHDSCCAAWNTKGTKRPWKEVIGNNYFDEPRMRKEFEKAIAENPNDPSHHLIYGDYLEERGHTKEARAHRAAGLAIEAHIHARNAVRGHLHYYHNKPWLYGLVNRTLYARNASRDAIRSSKKDDSKTAIGPHYNASILHGTAADQHEMAAEDHPVEEARDHHAEAARIHRVLEKEHLALAEDSPMSTLNSKKTSTNKIREYIKDEDKANKEYHQRGFDHQAKEEAEHEEFFRRLLRKRKKRKTENSSCNCHRNNHMDNLSDIDYVDLNVVNDSSSQKEEEEEERQKELQELQQQALGLGQEGNKQVIDEPQSNNSNHAFDYEDEEDYDPYYDPSLDAAERANQVSRKAHEATDSAHEQDSTESHHEAVLEHRKAAACYHQIQDVKAAEEHLNLAHEHEGLATEKMLSHGGYGPQDLLGYERPLGGVRVLRNGRPGPRPGARKRPKFARTRRAIPKSGHEPVNVEDEIYNNRTNNQDTVDVTGKGVPQKPVPNKWLAAAKNADRASLIAQSHSMAADELDQGDTRIPLEKLKKGLDESLQSRLYAEGGLEYSRPKPIAAGREGHLNLSSLHKELALKHREAMEVSENPGIHEKAGILHLKAARAHQIAAIYAHQKLGRATREPNSNPYSANSSTTSNRDIVDNEWTNASKDAVIASRRAHLLTAKTEGIAPGQDSPKSSEGLFHSTEALRAASPLRQQIPRLSIHIEAIHHHKGASDYHKQEAAKGGKDAAIQKAAQWAHISAARAHRKAYYQMKQGIRVGDLLKYRDPRKEGEHVGKVVSIDRKGDTATLLDKEGQELRLKGFSRLAHNSTGLRKESWLTPEVRKYAVLAKRAYESGNNPASWVHDESKWEKAKEAATKQYGKDSKAYWPVVVHIYENMGGKIKGRKDKKSTHNASSEDYDANTPNTGGVYTKPYHEARMKGYSDREGGASRSQNPYRVGSSEYAHWQNGWDDHYYNQDKNTNNSSTNNAKPITPRILPTSLAAVKDHGEAIARDVGKHINHPMLAGVRAALRQHIGAVRESHEALSNDTGLDHMAAAYENQQAASRFRAAASNLPQNYKARQLLARRLNATAGAHERAALFHETKAGEIFPTENAEEHPILQTMSQVGQKIKPILQKHLTPEQYKGIFSKHLAATYASYLTHKNDTPEAHLDAARKNNEAHNAFRSLATEVPHIGQGLTALASIHKQAAAVHLPKATTTQNAGTPQNLLALRAVHAAMTGGSKPAENASKRAFLFTRQASTPESHLAAANEHDNAAEAHEGTKGIGSAHFYHARAALAHRNLAATLIATGTHNMSKTQKRGPEHLSKEHFAYTPDPNEPSTWKLRIDDAHHVGGALAAIGKGFRGEKVSIPKEDMPEVKKKILAAWTRFHKGQEVPKILANIDNKSTPMYTNNDAMGAITATKVALQSSKAAGGGGSSAASKAYSHAIEGNHSKAADYHEIAASGHNASLASKVTPQSMIPLHTTARDNHLSAAQAHREVLSTHNQGKDDNTSININGTNKNHSHQALKAAKKAHDTSEKSDEHSQHTTDAYEASKRAHHLQHRSTQKHLAKRAHEEAADAHDLAADYHDDLADDDDNEESRLYHEEAADHHREAADHHHEAAMELDQNHNTTINNDRVVGNAKKLHKMSDSELDQHHKELLAEKNRRDMNNFMGLTYQNPGEETPSSIAGEEYEDMGLDDIDWEKEFEGLGLSHNSTTNRHQKPEDTAWFKNMPTQYQEAVRNSVDIVNRERGMLLQQLTVNMNEQQKHYAIHKFGKMPIEDLRQVVSLFATNNQQVNNNSIQPPPLTPIYLGAGGGPGDLTTNTQQAGEDAILRSPTINWNEDEEGNPIKRRGNSGSQRNSA